MFLSLPNTDLLLKQCMNSDISWDEGKHLVLVAVEEVLERGLKK